MLIHLLYLLTKKFFVGIIFSFTESVKGAKQSIEWKILVYEVAECRASLSTARFVLFNVTLNRVRCGIYQKRAHTGPVEIACKLKLKYALEINAAKGVKGFIHSHRHVDPTPYVVTTPRPARPFVAPKKGSPSTWLASGGRKQIPNKCSPLWAHSLYNY